MSTCILYTYSYTLRLVGNSTNMIEYFLIYRYHQRDPQLLKMHRTTEQEVPEKSWQRESCKNQRMGCLLWGSVFILPFYDRELAVPVKYQLHSHFNNTRTMTMLVDMHMEVGKISQGFAPDEDLQVINVCQKRETRSSKVIYISNN